MPISREEIISQIQKLAKSDGTTPGRQRFQKVTGINMHEWYGRFWAKWGDAIEEAGLVANSLQEQFGKKEVLRSYIALTEKLGRVPTEGDIRLARRSDTSFPAHSTLANHLGPRRKRLQLAIDFAQNSSVSASTLAMLREAFESLPAEPDVPEAEINSVGTFATGFVYLIKSGKFYKIGKTNSPDRRQYEIGLDLAEGVKPIHSIETDDPSGIEAYWHSRFKSKRMNGEWFNLDAADIRAFRLRKKFM